MLAPSANAFQASSGYASERPTIAVTTCAPVACSMRAMRASIASASAWVNSKRQLPRRTRGVLPPHCSISQSASDM